MELRLFSEKQLNILQKPTEVASFAQFNKKNGKNDIVDFKNANCFGVQNLKTFGLQITRYKLTYTHAPSGGENLN